MSRVDKPAVLLILDGWGYRKNTEGNAIALAKTPNWDALIREYPWTLLHCKGEWVGLSPGQMGNSEVGHLNIGAGRRVLQPLTKIDEMIRTGKFYQHRSLTAFLKLAAERGGTLHLIGLTSDGGVHSHINHLFALLNACANAKVGSVAVHAFLDGRDTSPTAGIGFIKKLLKELADYPFRAELATVSGRYYAMDRDKRWERTEKAYRVITEAKSDIRTDESIAHLRKSYEGGVTDEFVHPFVSSASYAGMLSDDAVLFFNFREDRARQLSWALTRSDFPHFPRPLVIKHFFSFSKYAEDFTNPTLLSDDVLSDTVTELLTSRGLSVFKCAETEKYAHVTYFFNGGREEPFPGEERVLIPSPKVPTYDLKPEMSAFEVAEASVKAIMSGRFALCVINLANGDMVGHTGVLPAGIRAAEAVDECLGEILKATNFGRDAYLFVTADHGNFEQMINEDGTVSTQHSLNPVPLVLVGSDKVFSLPLPKEVNRLPDDADANQVPENQSLRDIIPTILKLMGIPLSTQMDGSSLLAD